MLAEHTYRAVQINLDNFSHSTVLKLEPPVKNNQLQVQDACLGYIP